MKFRPGPLFAGLAIVALSLATAPLRAGSDEAAKPAAPADVDFQRDIKPIFREHCYECHGPDKRKGGLRLSNRRDAFIPGDLGVPVIEPERSDLSPLFELITSQDPEERMPKKKDPLPPEKIERIKRWIEAGAPWPAEADATETHWAYQKPVRPALPAVRDEGWARNEIDRFVLARLEAEGLRPAPEADRVTLARRLYFDLTGLPPTPEEIDAFVADESPEAYERLVDRLLASPRFGEKWARLWLDAARYADSTGFQADRLKPNWPYRDWVIGAINDDMPYDEFTVEQLAGDLLPNPTLDQQIATGFHRSAPLNLEAGIQPEESRVAQVMDRVNTTSAIWLGSTIECAQCHNHKFDPFSQEEYYRLLAFFNDTAEESAPLGNSSYQPAGPEVQIPLTGETRRERDELLERLRALLEREGALAPTENTDQQNLQTVFAKLVKEGSTTRAGDLANMLLRARAAQLPESEFKDWVRQIRAAVRRGEPHWQVLDVISFEGSGGERSRMLEDGSVLVSGPVPDTSTYVIKARANLAGITALKLETLRDESLPGKGPGRGDEESPEFVVSELEIAREVPGGAATEPLELYGPLASHDHRLGNVAAAIDGKVDTGWSIADEYGRDHWAIFLLDHPLSAEDRVTLVFTIRQNAGFGKTIGRLRLLATGDSVEAVSLPNAVARGLAAKAPPGPLERKLRSHFTATHVDAAVQRELRAIRRRLPAHEMDHALVMQDLEEPRETHVLKRGNYLDPGDKVAPGTPAVLHPMSPDLPKNRLGLARWLVDPNDPLIGRVTVNQWWGDLFGRGLVSTPEDFGMQGERPTHPELLDWLAVELVESGWSRKHVLREMVTSATYRQASRPATPEVLEHDPENVLLTRNPRLRLPAELVRDNALAIAGLLSPKMGGPAVYPPQPDGLWKLTGTLQPTYTESDGEDRYRRGIYTVWRRSSPYPSFMNFDAKDRTACVLKRSRTNTPLQALTLLNDEAYVEAALALAERILEERPVASAAERARHGFRLAVGREPTAAEVAELEQLLAAQQDRIRERSAMATELFGSVPSFAPHADVDRQELAAWYFVASTLLNLDETITRG